MNKLITIFGAVIFALLVLSSCGSPEKDGKAMAKCFCDAKNGKLDEKAQKECDELEDELDEKYEDDDKKEDEMIKAFENAMKDC